MIIALMAYSPLVGVVIGALVGALVGGRYVKSTHRAALALGLNVGQVLGRLGYP